MNHKDFIKNYLPGLTRGVYAVRLLLKVAPTLHCCSLDFAIFFLAF